MVHLTSDELGQWQSGHLDHERVRVIGHLAECAACAERLAVMVRATSVEPLASDEDVTAFRDAGRRAGEGPAAPRAINWSRLALAAAVILAVGSTVYFFKLGEPTGVERGSATGTVALSTPVGAIDGQAPWRFAWTGTTGPVRVVVVELERGSAPVVDRAAEGGTLTLEAADRARLLSGHEYRWFLEYRDAAGAVRSTPIARFTIR